MRRGCCGPRPTSAPTICGLLQRPGPGQAGGRGGRRARRARHLPEPAPARRVDDPPDIGPRSGRGGTRREGNRPGARAPLPGPRLRRAAGRDR